MTHPGSSGPSEFGDFENDFNSSKKAEPGINTGDLIPESVYKFVLVKQDLKGDGKLADYEIFKANTGTTGFKLFCEVLEPGEVVTDKGEKVVTKGMVQEHVFWISQKNMPFLKRDIATILGRDLKSLNELKEIVWTGHTFEGGVRHELNKRNFKESRISFFNAWKPEQQSAAPPAKEGTAQPGQPVSF